MLKKVIKYTDYMGNEREEECYFNLTKSELLEMQHSTIGGLKQKLLNVLATQDNVQIMHFFKDFILKSYGRISDDGRRFEKSEQLSTEFSQTGAFDQLFIELAGDEKIASQFVNGLIPADLLEAIEKENNVAEQNKIQQFNK